MALYGMSYGVYGCMAVWLYTPYALYSVTGEPGRGEGAVAVVYSLYSGFPYRKVYSPTLPPLGSWAQMAVGSGRWRTSWSRDCGSEVSGVSPNHH